MSLNSTNLNMCSVLSSKKLSIHQSHCQQTDTFFVRLCRIFSHHAEMITTCHVVLSLSYVTGLISPAYPWRSNRESSPCNFLCMRAKGRGEQMRPLPRRPSGSQPLPSTTGSSHDESPPHIFPCDIWILLGYFTTSTWALIHLPLLLSQNRFTQGYTAMCMFYVWFKWAVFYKFHHWDREKGAPWHRSFHAPVRWSVELSRGQAWDTLFTCDELHASVYVDSKKNIHIFPTMAVKRVFGSASLSCPTIKHLTTVTVELTGIPAWPCIMQHFHNYNLHV